MSEPSAGSHKLINRIVETFLHGNMSVVFLFISLLAGIAALSITPREEDPQIVVPMADVMVSMPGASAEEVERQVSTPLEKLLYQIPGVEYVYSISNPSASLVTVRFYVGEDLERSWVKLYNKIDSNIDKVPPGVTGWVIKPKEIDDVPIVDITLYSAKYSDYELRRMAEELEIRLQGVTNAGPTYLVGGRPRELTVHLLPERMAGRGIGIQDIERALRGANVSLEAGDLTQRNTDIRLKAGRFLTSAQQVSDLIVAVHQGLPVYLWEVAHMEDGPAETSSYTRIAFGPGAFTDWDPATQERTLPPGIERYHEYSAVTVAVAKRKETNAVWVSQEVQKEARIFAQNALPEGVLLRVTRDYGRSANDKVNDLVEALVVAIIIVIALLAYTLGWREGLIIALAVPVTFSLTLLINYLLGYTINRVTLFALILALGLVVDDPIVDVENIHRHFAMRKGDLLHAVLEAVNEVRPPIILATLAVIISFLPMFFITGMMGPYMAPMALNVPLTMLMSMVVAFTITPWLSYHFLRGASGKAAEKAFVLEDSPLFRIYQRIMDPFFRSAQWRRALITAVVVLLAFAGWLVVSRRVPLKMLPFDNKDELEVILDMPRGTTLEATQGVSHAFADYLMRVPEVTDVTTFVGTNGPMDFNGLVRHYYLRDAPYQGDVRLNLVAKKRRAQQSHALALRLRNDLTEIARGHEAEIQIVETPPGPPVIATLVAEIFPGGFGQPYQALVDAGRVVRRLMAATPGVVDLHDVIVAPQKEMTFRVDRAKAMLNGISDQEVVELLHGAVAGQATGALRLPDQVHPLPIVLRLPRDRRTLTDDLTQLAVKEAGGNVVFLSELGAFEEKIIDQPIYHKNLRPVVYIFGDTAGLPPPDAVLTLNDRTEADRALAPYDVNWFGEGEMHITIQVFRDMGIAFLVAVLGIYILLLYQTQSYLLPAIQLIALPLSIIGIIPGFWLLNLAVARPVGGWPNPIYFTATGMIGMIALAGIATRNAILLIEFVEERKKEGKPVTRSLLEAGALRTRPIFLTSMTVMLAAWPITLDPIFSGLAWALIFGVFVSTLFTLVVVPVVYYIAYAKRFSNQAESGQTS
jgi:multidrug efflux pump subunit AcrB